jgi:SsrA-binding protein
VLVSRVMADVLTHKKARLEYEILEEFEAGLELLGFEVKALRAHQGKLEGAHVVIRGGEAYVVGMSIPPYQPANTPIEYDAARVRKLLVTKKELGQLAGYEGQKGLTIVPISVYNKGTKLKVRIAVARGKKARDKREDLKKKSVKRDIERTLKNQ